MDILFIAFLLITLFWSQASFAVERDSPPLMMARIYQQGIDVTHYYVSEKLDGVRAYWNGEQLLTRTGRTIHAPDWFLAALPDTPLDGELWAGRERFDWVSGLSRKIKPTDSDWLQVKYMVFDLPAMVAPFTERLQALHTLVSRQQGAQLNVVEHSRVASEQELQQRLNRIIAAGGEGLMLRRAGSFYQAARSDDLLKLKRAQDDEAIVVAHLPGDGKYQGAMGSLLVRMDDGREFRIGTGFTDQERYSPPPVGSQVTFAYNGLTEYGLPRFARFIRIRPPE